MKAKGPKTERETVINFNEAEDNASIWTASEPFYRKLLKLGYTPTEERDRSATFSVPKKLVAVRKEQKLSAERRRALAEKARFLRNGTVITVDKQANPANGVSD